MPDRSNVKVLLSAALLAGAACNNSSNSERPAASGTVAAVSGEECAAKTYASVPYRGVSLSGAEWGSNYPGQEGVDFVWARTSEIDFFLAKGMNTFRIGFQWERLQPTLYAAFAPTYFARLDALVTYATSHGGHVILNPHNFARYQDQLIGSAAVPDAAFADLWSRLASKYADNPLVLMNLVNEPHDMPTEQWVSAAKAAIAAIRNADATSPIIVPGNAWTGGGSWTSDWYGTPNSVAMLEITDPGVLFEAHQYFDEDMSGGSGDCVSPSVGSDRIAGFVDWLRKNGKQGFIGEFAGGSTSTCNAAVTDFLGTIMASADVLQGWLWWAGGPWWADDYIYRVEPTTDGAEAPAWANLSPYLEGGTCSVPPAQVVPPASAAPDGGADSAAPGGGADVTYTASSEMVVSNGTSRRFVLAVPSPAEAEPLPLVLVLHADQSSAESAREDGPQLEAQAKGAAIFAYLQAPDDHTFPYWEAAGRGVEAMFVKDIIALLASRGIVRTDRVFITGVSGGATMTNAISCVLGSSVLRASVVMSGSFYAVDGLWATLPDGTEIRACADAPAVQIQWGQDDRGDTDFVTAGQRTRDLHRSLLGCGEVAQDAWPSPCVTYDACEKPVSWCAIPGMGHAVWANAAAAAWSFIQAVP